jgi:hypothetical protein
MSLTPGALLVNLGVGLLMLLPGVNLILQGYPAFSR